MGAPGASALEAKTHLTVPVSEKESRLSFLPSPQGDVCVGVGGQGVYRVRPEVRRVGANRMGPHCLE